MECITWCAPILPGKLDQWKAFDRTMQGPRAAEHAASRARHGITREVVSLMDTPMGELVCLYHEAESISAALRSIATSQEPYDVWFREQLVELHGLSAEMMQGPPPATLYMDFRAGSAVPQPRTVDLTQKQPVR